MTELPEPCAERIDEQFDGADWDGLDLTGVTFRRCHFLEASMVELRVDRCVFEDCTLTGVRLNAAQFTDTALRSSTLAKAVLFGVVSELLTAGDLLHRGRRTRNAGIGQRSFLCRVARRGRIETRPVRRSDAGDRRHRRRPAGYRSSPCRSVLRSVEGSQAGADLRGATVDAINWTTVDLTDVQIDMAQALAVAMSYGAQIDSPDCG